MLATIASSERWSSFSEWQFQEMNEEEAARQDSKPVLGTGNATGIRGVGVGSSTQVEVELGF